MLQDIRDSSQSTIAKIIIGLVVLSLSVFGVDAIVGGFGGEPSVATVNETDITDREFQRAVQMQRQQILSQMDRPDASLLDEGEINRQVLDSLINRSLIYQDALARGLELTDAEIDQLIVSIPAFQVDGVFSQERFLSLVRSRGMGVQEFREALRRDYIASQVRNTVAGSAFAVPATSRTLLALQQQSRKVATLALDTSVVADQVSVSDADIETYYSEHADSFTRAETVDVAWVAVDREAIKNTVEVSEETLRQRYQQQVDAMDAREERRAAHILLVPEDGDQVDPGRVAEVQAALDEGQDFAEVAKTLSDDPGSASSGGDLGFASRGSFDPAFSDALFEIAREGEVAGPVETSYGVHFIKLLDLRTLDKPGFEEMRDNLRNEIAAERANQLYLEQSDRLADIAFSAFDLEEPAAELGLDVERAEGVTREGNAPPFDHAGLLRQLFSDDVLAEGNNSELVEVGDGISIVARVLEHHPEQQLALEQVRDDIRSLLLEQHTAEALAEKASGWLDALNEGTDPAEIASEAGAEWTETREVQRDSSGLPVPVLMEVFRLPHPEGSAVFGKADVPSGLTLIQLVDVATPAIEEDDPSIAQVQALIAQQLGAEVSQLYLEALRESATIERQ